MKKQNDNNLTSFADHLDEQFGKRGTVKRDTYEQEFEAFKLGVLIQEMRESQNMTQEQLAIKCGTTKSYISRIENHASDIRLSSLMHILQEGFGMRLKFSLG
jgi:DNA-binding XRE family transcriptional regulator